MLLVAWNVGASSSGHPGPAAAAAARSRRGGRETSLVVVNLRGEDDRDRVALALHAHDLCLAGFRNRSHHWHAFPGHEHALPGSTPLPFGSTYRDLIGGLANLPSLPLGRGPALQAARALAAYDPASDDADAGAVGPAKRGLAALAVATSESPRLRPVREAVSEGTSYIEHWDTICYEVTRARRTGVWGGPFAELLRERAGIRGEEDALAVVDVLVNRTLGDVLTAHALRP
uniref:rRNA N-glycosylase n=1 Tax=Setaria viridis TaxID=4556 RepID=A0A4U6TSH9_SETVI|nr:hypothetical protein SEVIR_7G147100v2 [Setaria viridis]